MSVQYTKPATYGDIRVSGSWYCTQCLTRKWDFEPMAHTLSCPQYVEGQPVEPYIEIKLFESEAIAFPHIPWTTYSSRLGDRPIQSIFTTAV
jgi:hypothetical protein